MKIIFLTILSLLLSTTSNAQNANKNSRNNESKKLESFPVRPGNGMPEQGSINSLDNTQGQMLRCDEKQSLPKDMRNPNGVMPEGRGRNERIITVKLNRNTKIADLLKERQKKLQDKFDRRDDNRATRGIAQAILSGYYSEGLNIVSSFANYAIKSGVEALLKTFKGHHDDWRKMNQNENTRTDSIIMHTQVNDYYNDFSTKGALDPYGLQFDGVTIETKKNDRTTFKLVTHLDTSQQGLDKILAHSKFSLVVDTLELDIRNCGLPNRDGIDMNQDNLMFTFDTRTSVSKKIHLAFTASYISPAIEVFNNVKLGSFDINLQGLEANDTIEGCRYEYHRGISDVNRKEPVITGESFIVPRSYNAMRDPETNEYTELYGLGEYKVDAILVTTCQNTPEFEKNWKADWKAYKERQKRNKIHSASIKNWLVQYFDQNSKSWATSLISAPVSSSKSYLQRLIQQNNGMNNMNGGMGGNMGGGMPIDMNEENGMNNNIPGNGEFNEKNQGGSNDMPQNGGMPNAGTPPQNGGFQPQM